jgi:hypothetical protein
MFNLVMSNKNPPPLKRGGRGDLRREARFSKFPVYPQKSPLTPLCERGGRFAGPPLAKEGNSSVVTGHQRRSSYDYGTH